MIHILRFNIDLISFLLGIVAAALLGLLFWGLKRLIGSLRTTWKESRLATDIKRKKSLEEAYLQVVNKKAQRNHLAFELFALEEILVEPRVILPPPVIDPANPDDSNDILDELFPFLPDNPVLSSRYPVAIHHLTEIVRNGGRFFLSGQAGSGKSTALAYLALYFSKVNLSEKPDNFYLPILLDIHELKTGKKDTIDPFLVIVDALTAQFPKLVQKDLHSLVGSYFENNRIIILLDGIDEQSPVELSKTEEFIKQLLLSFPKVSLVTTGFGKSIELFLKYNFQLLLLSSWNKNDVSSLITKWSSHWRKDSSTSENETDNPFQIDPILLAQWVQEKDRILSPLEWTLRIWAGFAHDSNGINEKDCISTFIDRICDPSVQMDLQKLVQVMLDRKVSSLSVQFTRSKLSPNNLSNLLEKGLLDLHGEDRITFCNPSIAADFARKLPAQFSSDDLNMSLNWNILYEGIRINLQDEGIKSILNLFDSDKDRPLFARLITINRMFINPSIKAEAKDILLRTLFLGIQNEDLPSGLRLNLLLSILMHPGNAKSFLLRELSKSKSEIVRQITALGIGFTQDEKLLPDLEPLLGDETILVRGSALYALAQFDQAESIHQLTDALMYGDEETKLLAAGAIASCHEGYELLKKAAKAKDILVRRAVVQSISKVRAEWVIPFLNQISVEDDQWIVRNAAVNSLEQIQKGSFVVIHPLPPPSEASWLIQIASTRGTGIPAGRAPIALLLEILNTGSIEEQLGALDYLKLLPEGEVLKTIYQKFTGQENIVREKAYYCLWLMQQRGSNLLTVID